MTREWIRTAPAAAPPSKTANTSIKEDGESIMVMFLLSLEQPSILYVPRVKEQPGSTHNIPPTLNAWLLPCWPSLADDWLVHGGRGWWGLAGGWAEACFPMHHCSPGKEQGWSKGGQRWWCGKWEWYEGCRGRDINEEQRRGRRGKRGERNWAILHCSTTFYPEDR